MIKGQFRVAGASPDGDSVRFYPDRADAFSAARLKVRTNSRGGVQLRLDGIDALETHYRPRVAGAELWYQPKELADAAGAELLRHLGFTKVERDEGGRVSASTPGETSGHILTRFADKYGRAVAFAFPGQRAGRSTDGGSVHLEPKTLKASANFRLLETGSRIRRSTPSCTRISGRRWPTRRSRRAPRARACGSTTSPTAGFG
ncbi:conserved hypothetical protein [Streptomyces sp. AA4]|nr:conserved hypothetical protein [Streptomyces sp. AA4]